MVRNKNNANSSGAKKLRAIGRYLYIALIIVFLYAPIATLVVLSFNASKSRAVWGGFTLQWYSALFQNAEIMTAFGNTLVIALVSALIATVIGTMACIAMNRMKKVPRTILVGVSNIPMLNADIVTGISLMLLFIALNFTLGFFSVLLAHITFNIPYVVLSVMPKLQQTNRSTYEAALDLGATHFYAFRKVIFPDIFPGILSGFMLAFTMSLDDFVITHFTKGPGVDTLSTKIYSEVRKGIKPEMYALSTLLFLSVLILLVIINRRSAKPVEKKERTSLFAKLNLHFSARTKIVVSSVAAAVVVFAVGTALFAGKGQKADLYIYNWGEYMDKEVIEIFEQETGLKVKYDEFETNESMYPKVSQGAVKYDLICPSDYMIQRMIKDGLLAELNFDNIPNISNIGATYMESSREFDPANKYSVPYCWGTVGILYNKTMVDEPIDSWGALFDPKYQDNILMQKSVRDAMGMALKYLGYSLNSTNRAELEDARDLLFAQKDSGVVQAYVVDEVRDKMIGNTAAIGVIYSGEAIYTQRENPDLEYVIPKEGSNIWIDSWVIPKNAEHKETAEKFINFLCRPDIALMNFEYITYSTPNVAARELIEDEDIRNSKVAFPDDEMLENCETFQYLGSEADAMYNEMWREVLSE